MVRATRTSALRASCHPCAALLHVPGGQGEAMKRLTAPHRVQVCEWTGTSDCDECSGKCVLALNATDVSVASDRRREQDSACMTLSLLIDTWRADVEEDAAGPEAASEMPEVRTYAEH